MRLNVFIAQATGLSRRQADDLIGRGLVEINGSPAKLGTQVEHTDRIMYDGVLLQMKQKIVIALNKPVGYVCSRAGQGSKTIYDLLPDDLKHLKPVGRLDKDTSGLILLTNDGQLAEYLTHPRYAKQKIYEVKLDVPLTPPHKELLTDSGVTLEDGPSKFDELQKLGKNDGYHWKVIMHEGRNRQIRRSFSALGYTIRQLHRTNFGNHYIGNLTVGHYTKVDL